MLAAVRETSPTGASVLHHDVRLGRAGRPPPVPFEITGLAPPLALFGADQPSERSAAPSD
jgi:hypothetical protein